MTHREKIRTIAYKCWLRQETETCTADQDMQCIEQAILAGIEAVLGAEPSEGMRNAAWPKRSGSFDEIYRAMSAELIKELKC